MSVLDFLDKAAGNWLDWRRDQAAKKMDIPPVDILNVQLSNAGMEAVLEHPAIAYLADEASALLDKANARNYLQIDLMPRADRGTNMIRVTIQRAEGMSPATKNIMLEQQIKVLEKEIAELKGGTK